MAEKCTLILGGARSRKSQYAQEVAAKLGNRVLFVATGEALDEEMQVRIDGHKKDRPEGWRTLEAPTDVGKHLEKHIGDAEVVIVDCLTLLVSNLLGDKSDPRHAEEKVLTEIDALTASMHKTQASFLIVSNEVGTGLVPETDLGRIYRDLLGKANQLIAQHADEVYLMVAGIPVKVKER